MMRINRRTTARIAAGVAGFAVLTAAVTLGARNVRAGSEASPPPAAGSAAAAAGLGDAPVPSAVKAPGSVPAVEAAAAPAAVNAPAPVKVKAPAQTKDRIPSSIPARAFLRASDAPGRGSTPERRDGGELPDFCGLSYEQTGRLGIRATQFMYITEKNPPPNSTPKGTVLEDIMVFRGDGADRFLDDLRAAVRSCPTETRGTVTVTNVLRGGLGVGDESILIERNQPAFGGDGEPTGDGTLHRRFWAAVRVGDSVAFVANSGWETASADRGDTAYLGSRAGFRLDAWR
ncbi:hypothetical protein AB0M54_14655 [Actinoplanes sp. NPDC051470]|uniref:hypothetical protein n=1 Tax=unclassified Actinoplanes TaxID=2626549 RepID=UPI00341C7524